MSGSYFGRGYVRKNDVNGDGGTKCFDDIFVEHANWATLLTPNHHYTSATTSHSTCIVKYIFVVVIFIGTTQIGNVKHDKQIR